jgi:hypothetical protein
MRNTFAARSLGVALVAGLAAGCTDSSQPPFEPSALSADVGTPAPAEPAVPEVEPAPQPPPAPPAQNPPSPAPARPSSSSEDDSDVDTASSKDAAGSNKGKDKNTNKDDPPPPEDEVEPEPPAEVASPTAPTLVNAEFVVTAPRSKLKVSWAAVAGATSYIVELGSSAGSKNLGVVEVATTSLSTDQLPWGRTYARVRAKNGGGTSNPSRDVSEWFFDFRDYIEAIFVGTGPLAPSDGNHGCSATGWVRGFPRGTDVPVLVSTTVSSAKVSAIKDTISQVSSATGGGLRSHYVQTTDPNPLPGQGEATSTTHEDASSVGCATDHGCTIHVFVSNSQPGRFKSSRAVQPGAQTPEAYAHDAVGHGVLGLCHVDGNRIGGASRSLMSAGPGVYSGDIAGRLTTYDLKASQALYGSGLDAGDTRQNLVSAGLIKP